MFQVRYRFVFILALAVYSYLNIRYTVGDRLFDFEVPALGLFALLLVVVMGVWELNRIVQGNLSKLHRFFKSKVHPLLILFLFNSFSGLSQSSFIHPRGLIDRNDLIGIRQKIEREPYKTMFLKLKETTENILKQDNIYVYHKRNMGDQ